MNSPAIEISNVSRTFGKRKSLDHVNLTIGEGELVALLGPSGAGKSTLLRAAAALITTDRGGGTVSVSGRIVQSDGKLAPRVRSIRSGIGFIFQQFNLVARLPLITNVLTGGLSRMPAWRRLFRYFTESERRAAMEAISTVGMAEYAAQRASTLSGGQQQRGAVARAIVQRAKVLLADEPIASLDPESARLVMESLRRVNRSEGTTVVVSVHQVEFARTYSDRIIAMSNGRVVCDCASHELDIARLREIYGPNYADLGASPSPESSREQAVIAANAEAIAGA